MSWKIMLFLCIPCFSYSQNYTNYFTGNTTDKVSTAEGGICMMGGRSEDDNAMKWFLRRAKGGDVLVLRASGSDGYNSYLYSELGIEVNSVETIVCNNRNASFDPEVIKRIEKAEAIWFAGGDQWKYISYWRNTPVDSAINVALSKRNIVIGGTSAGMAILGQYYFSAENGTISSQEALTNPYDIKLTVSQTPFLKIPLLQDVITDTHFDNPDRKGRLITFLARTFQDSNKKIRAIACDEYTAICIDPDGTASVYGGHPTEDDNAYFIHINCDLTNAKPEICKTTTLLTWNHSGKALSIFATKGTQNGSHQINLKDWKTTKEGTWKNWSVNEGLVQESNGQQPACNISSLGSAPASIEFKIYPNPAQDKIIIEPKNMGKASILLSDLHGQNVYTQHQQNSNEIIEIDTTSWVKGMYLLQIHSQESGNQIRKIMVQ